MSEEWKRLRKAARRSWQRHPRRWLAIASLFPLAIAGYLTVTSSWFLRWCILPQVGGALGGKLSATRVILHPFSSIKLSGVVLQAQGKAPLLQATEVEVRYPVWDLVCGRIFLDDIRVNGLRVNLARGPKGASNFDFLLSRTNPGSPSTASRQRPAGGPNVRIGRVEIRRASVNYTQEPEKGTAILARLEDVDLTLRGLANGRTATWGLEAEYRYEEAGAGARGHLSTHGELGLDPRLGLARLQTQLETGVQEAVGRFLEAKGVQLNLDIETSGENGSASELRIARRERILGALVASGPLDLARGEGRLQFEVKGIDQELLGLLATRTGGKWRASSLSATNHLEFSEHAQVLRLRGDFLVQGLGFTEGALGTPEVRFGATYEGLVNTSEKRATLENLTLGAQQKGREILRAALARPMVLDWSGGGNPTDESSFVLSLREVQLADWHALAAGHYPTGRLGMELQIDSKLAGRNLKLAARAQVEELALRVAGNSFAATNLAFDLAGTLEEFSRVDLTRAQVMAEVRPGAPSRVELQGTWDREKRTGAARGTLELDLASLAPLAGDPRLRVTSGRLAFSGAAQLTAPPSEDSPSGDWKASGVMHLEDFEAAHQVHRFDRGEMTLRFEAQAAQGNAQIENLVATFSPGGRPGGQFSMVGQHDFKEARGRAKLSAAGFDQRLLAGVLAPTLGGGRLESVQVGVILESEFGPGNQAIGKGRIELSDLQVAPPGTNRSLGPVSAVLELEGRREEDRFLLRQANLQLQQSARAAGRLEAGAEYDLGQKRGRGKLRVAEVNELVLRPFLAAPLGDHTLDSVTINGALDWSTAPEAPLETQGQLEVRNLLVHGREVRPPGAPIAVVAHWDAGMTGAVVRLRQCSGHIERGGALGGQFAFNGQYHTNTGAASGQITLGGLNQNALEMVLAPSLGEIGLQSVTAQLDAELQHDPRTGSRLEANLRVADLVLRSSMNALPAEPLAIALKIKAGLVDQRLSLEEFQLGLTETARARNVMRAHGNLDLSRREALDLRLRVESEALDLTPFADLLRSGDQGGNATSVNQAPPPTSEPEPRQLPFKDFTLEGQIGRLFLRDVEVRDLLAKLRIETSKVRLDPLEFGMNGGVVRGRAMLDLSRPGSLYEVALLVDKVPLAPLIATLNSPPSRKVRGLFSTELALRGEGVTGPSIRRHLGGKVGFQVHDAEIDVVDKASTPSASRGFAAAVLGPVAQVLEIPDLSQDPLTRIEGEVAVSAGEVEVRKFLAETRNLQTTVQGRIALADELNESRLLAIPVDVALQRDLAIRSRLARSEESAESPYVRLPNFVKVSGTVSQPVVATDKGVIAVLVLRAGTSTLRDPARLLPNGAKPLPEATTALPAATSATKVPSLPKRPGFP